MNLLLTLRTAEAAGHHASGRVQQSPVLLNIYIKNIKLHCIKSVTGSRLTCTENDKDGNGTIQAIWSVQLPLVRG